VSWMVRTVAGRWAVWLWHRVTNRPLPVEHAAEWLRIPEHSVEQVLETGALKSLHPSDVLEAARRMDRQRREYDAR
jgi:NADH:ubiquinone oxidoreductase subunit